MNRLLSNVALGLAGFSLSMLMICAAFEGGWSNTGYGTADSAGRTLGFNNPVTPELYAIIFSRTSLVTSIKAIGVYGVVCFLLQVTGIAILLLTRRDRRSWIRDAFFISQAAVFPFAWLGMIFAPGLVYDILRGRADGEAFTDVVPVSWIAHSCWVTTAALIFIMSRIARRAAAENLSRVDAGVCAPVS